MQRRFELRPLVAAYHRRGHDRKGFASLSACAHLQLFGVGNQPQPLATKDEPDAHADQTDGESERCDVDLAQAESNKFSVTGIEKRSRNFGALGSSAQLLLTNCAACLGTLRKPAAGDALHGPGADCGDLADLLGIGARVPPIGEDG